MKNNSGSKTIHVLKQVFNVRKWCDWDRTKSTGIYLSKGIKQFLIPQKNKRTESFKTAQKRLNLSDSELLKRQNGLLRACTAMLIFASLMFFYTLYLIYFLKFKAIFLSVVVIMLSLVFAFRYHFWYFQMKQRKLGCSFKEWYEQGLRGRKPS